MRLTVNRREERETGLFKKPTAYFLDVTLQATPEEGALLAKHGWEDLVMCRVAVQSVNVPGLGGLLGKAVQRRNDRQVEYRVRELVGVTKSFPFDSIEQLADAESQIIENARALKQQLEAAAGFATGGPREVEL